MNLLPTVALAAKSNVETVAEALALLEPAVLDGFLEEASQYVGLRGQDLAKLWDYVDEEIPSESKRTEAWKPFDSVLTGVISDPEKWMGMLVKLIKALRQPKPETS